MPGDYPAICEIVWFFPGMLLNKPLWLGSRLPEPVINLNGWFIGDGVRRKAIPSLDLLCLR